MKLLCIFGLVYICVGSPCARAQANQSDPAPRFTKTEQWVMDQLKAGRPADVGNACQSGKDEQDCNVLSREFLEYVLFGSETPIKKEIVITNAVVADSLDFSGRSINNQVALSGFEFKRSVTLAGTTFKQDLLFERSTFRGKVNADNLHVDGHLVIKGDSVDAALDLSNAFVRSDMTIAGSSFADELILRRASIGNKLLIQSSTFKKGINADLIDIYGSFYVGANTTIEDRPLSLKSISVGSRLDFYQSTIGHGVAAPSMVVKGSVLFSETDITGDIDMSGSQVQNDLQFERAKLRSPVRANRIRLGGSLLFLRSSTFEERLEIEDASIGGSFNFTDSSLMGGLAADRVRIDGGMIFDHGKLAGPATLIDTVIGTDLSLSHVEISGPPRTSMDDGALLAKGIRVGGTIYCGPELLERSGGVNFLEAHVGGNIEIAKSNISTDLLVPLAHVDQNIFVHNNAFGGKLLMNGVMVGRHLDLAGNRIGDVDLNRAVISGDFRVSGGSDQTYKWPTIWRPGSSLDLRHAHVGVIQDECNFHVRNPGASQCKAWPDEVKLEGFSFDQFGSQRSVAWVASWLKGPGSFTDRVQPFDPQPYEEMANYFKRIGAQDDSDDIRTRARDLELVSYRAQCISSNNAGSCWQFARLAFLKIFVGYGIGYGLFAVLLPTLLFVGIGYLVLQFSSVARNKGPIWCLGASLNKLIPGVNLSKEFSDAFERRNILRLHRIQITYFFVHTLLGIALAAFIVAAIGGLTQAR